MLLIAKPNIISAIPNLGYFIFFKPNRGATNPFSNLESRQGLNYSQTQNRVWELFAPHFNPLLNNGLEIMSPTHPNGVNEGDKRLVEHISKETAYRNSAIVKLAKAIAYQNGRGHIYCACCDFDFISNYGQHGDGFIECHHRTPIASGGTRITEIEHLALVCSNCHRMLHRTRSDNSYFMVEELRELINDNRSQT